MVRLEATPIDVRIDRVIGSVTGAVLGLLVAILPLEWWEGLRVGVIPVSSLAVPTAAILGGVFGPGLRTANSAEMFRVAIMFVLLTPVTGATIFAILLTVVNLADGAPYPLAAPFGLALLGLLSIGPAVVVVAIPAALAWSGTATFVIRRRGRGERGPH